VLVWPERTLFICDTYVNPDPKSEEVAEMTLLTKEEVTGFGIVPRVAWLSHSSFGSAKTQSARKTSDALELIRQRDPTPDVEGEMHGDAALSMDILNQVFPNSRPNGKANVLIMPTLDAAASLQLAQDCGREWTDDWRDPSPSRQARSDPDSHRGGTGESST